MPIEIDCKNFSGHLSSINGTQTLRCSKAKVLLAALTCGYDGFFKEFGQNWFKRLLHIGGSVLPYITVKPGSILALDSYYLATDRSESTQGIYYIGQGLTKMFAQEFLAAPVVLHASRCSWKAATGNALKVPHVELKRQEADLFAFGQGAVHVLEAKGRAVKNGSGILSTSAFNNALNEALVQVSAINLVNGVTPASRCACVWTLCTSGIRGDIVDPAGDGVNAIVEENEILRGNYALFFDADDTSFRTDVLRGYSMLPVELKDEPETYIGILTEILSQLRGGRASIQSAISLGRSAATRAAPDPRVEFMDDGTVLCVQHGSKLSGNVEVPFQQEFVQQRISNQASDGVPRSAHDVDNHGEAASEPERIKIYLSNQ
ncbi:hypothetical protein [Rhizobium leguminosarum]|uniref:hypothetical protein n=1 Tax=Rhizobium leguminosarum TaxID=384 RepID=UPI003F980A4A